MTIHTIAPLERVGSSTLPPATVLYRELIQARREIRTLRQEVYTLSQQVALFWHPARENWERHSAPPTEESQSPTLLLPVAQEMMVAHVTIDQYQYCRSYDADGNPILRWWGYFNKIGVPLLAKTGRLEWKLIEADSPPAHPAPETPIPRI